MDFEGEEARKILASGETEKFVFLDQIEVCAIEATLNNVAKEKQEAIGAIAKAIGSADLKEIMESFSSKEPFHIYPAPKVNTVFSNLAHLGMLRTNRKANPETPLPCGHTIEEHEKGLESVLRKFSVTEN